jgi:hypothetical protein
MQRGRNLTPSRAEHLDARPGGSDRLGEDQCDCGGRRFENRFRRWVGLNQLRVGVGGLRDEGGGDRENGDRQSPREPQE